MVWAILAMGEPCASMPTASITESAPRPSVRSRIACLDVVDVGGVDGLDAVAAGHLQPLGHAVDPDHPTSLVDGDAGGHLADRAEAEDRPPTPPSGTSANATACQAVGSTSDRNRNRSSGGPRAP